MHLVQGILLSGLICWLMPVHAVVINASTDWSTCALADTVSDAGDYYASTIESVHLLHCNDALLSVTGLANSTTTWTISARLAALPSATLNLELIRVGVGIGNSSPNGGDNYLLLSTAYQDFFTGQGNITDIPLQFRVNNLDPIDGNGAKDFQIEYQITTTN